MGLYGDVDQVITGHGVVVDSFYVKAKCCLLHKEWSRSIWKMKYAIVQVRQQGNTIDVSIVQNKSVDFKAHNIRLR